MTAEPRQYDESDFYIYQSRIDRIVDGDTIDVWADLGFETVKRIRIRLLGVDTAETYGQSKDSEEFKRGVIHTQFVHEWAKQADGREWPFVVATEKDGTGRYGRYLAELVRRSDGSVLNVALREEFPETATD